MRSGGDGQPRGRSDVNIDNGISPESAASAILDGLAADQREIVIAEGREKMAYEMRHTNPEALFAFAAQEGAKLAAQREAIGAGKTLEPNRLND